MLSRWAPGSLTVHRRTGIPVVMGKNVTLVLCIHNHQPVGNFDHVFKEVTDKCYEPFLTMLEEHPSFKIALHYSGPLLEWLPQSFLDRVRTLVAAGQVELLTSGFYEPILPIIPFDDAVDQISAFTSFLKEKFSAEPQGFWLTERVWEPDVPEIAARCGLKYTLTDDTHFLHAGLRTEDLNGYYITEYQGAILNVFPISKNLRYLIPFREPAETVDYLESLPDGSIAVYGDDGEKFGAWPGTYDHIWKKKWLERFITEVQKASWITLKHPSALLSALPPRGRIYLPTDSYDEMGEWSLPAGRQTDFTASIDSLRACNMYAELRPFLRGGYFRNFFAKYSEANNLHKKMVYVSRKVASMRERGKARAKRELWKGQGNCAYWHGIFGGLYLPHLREALYSHLISAEVIADKELRGRSFINVQQFDHDCDGHTETVVETSLLSLYLHPVGGRIYELDYRPSAINLGNTLTRREEAYHRSLRQASAATAKGTSIHDIKKRLPSKVGRHLVYDRTPRHSLIDHILPPETSSDEFARVDYSEYENLSDVLYGRAVRRSGEGVEVELSRRSDAFELRKIIGVEPDRPEVVIDYDLSSDDLHGHLFAVEFNLSLKEPRAISGPVDKVEISDVVGRVAVSLKFDSPAQVWTFPVKTVSQSESGYDLIYQGFTLVSLWKIGEAGLRAQVIVRMRTG